MMLNESKQTHGKPTKNEPVAAHVQAKDLRMKKPPQEYVTLVEVLELMVPYEEFEEAIRAALARLEAEGVRELVHINFYAEPDSTEVGAILVFSDGERFLDHIGMISSWEEFRKFFATAKPLDVRIYGRLNAEAEAWISQFGDIVGKKFGRHAAGFVR